MSNRSLVGNSVVSKENLSTKSIGKLLIAIHGFNFIQSMLASVLLRKEANNCKKIDEIVELCFHKFSNSPYKYFEWEIKPIQVKEELVELLKIVRCRKPKVLLEIGTANGGTLFSFTKTMPQDGIVISIDLPRKKFSKGYAMWRVPFYKSFATHAQRVFLVRLDSHSRATFNKVTAILNKHVVDFLFIDGDHSYAGVKRDFEMYAPLVNRGGIVAFHDILLGPRERGVPKFWSEIREKHRYLEIVEDWSQGKAGIGVLYV